MTHGHKIVASERPTAVLVVVVALVHHARGGPPSESAPVQYARPAGHPDQINGSGRMRLIGRVPVNRTLSNIYSDAPNLNHQMKRGKEVEEERPNALSAKYRASPGVRSHLDFVGVECVENLKIFFPAPANIGGDDRGVQDPLPRVISIPMITGREMMLSTY
jgi:hypothetical protein